MGSIATWGVNIFTRAVHSENVIVSFDPENLTRNGTVSVMRRHEMNPWQPSINNYLGLPQRTRLVH